MSFIGHKMTLSIGGCKCRLLN